MSVVMFDKDAEEAILAAAAEEREGETEQLFEEAELIEKAEKKSKKKATKEVK